MPAVVALRDNGLGRLALRPLLDMLSTTGTPSFAIYRVYAADRIAILGSQAKEAVGALTMALDDSEAFPRISAARALREIGPEARTAVPSLVAMASGKDEKNWQGMADEFWRGTIKRAIQQIDPGFAKGSALK